MGDVLGSDITTEHVIDNGVLSNQVVVEDLSDVVNIDDFLRETNNDRLFRCRHKKHVIWRWRIIS